MLDVEKVKVVLQSEVNKREKARAKCDKYRSSGNKNQEEFYERRYNMYRNRFDGMCDMLYDLGFLAWANDENVVFVEKRVPYVDKLFDDLFVDEIPF